MVSIGQQKLASKFVHRSKSVMEDRAVVTYTETDPGSSLLQLNLEKTDCTVKSSWSPGLRYQCGMFPTVPTPEADIKRMNSMKKEPNE